MATKQMTTREALQWIAVLLEEPADRLSAETRWDDIPAWDSLGVLTLMAGLDERFDLRLSPEEMGALQSVGALLKILADRHCLTDLAAH